MNHTCSEICSGVMTTPTPQAVSKALTSTGSTGVDLKKSREATDIMYQQNMEKTQYTICIMRYYKIIHLCVSNDDHINNS